MALCEILYVLLDSSLYVRSDSPPSDVNTVGFGTLEWFWWFLLACYVKREDDIKIASFRSRYPDICFFYNIPLKELRANIRFHEVRGVIKDSAVSIRPRKQLPRSIWDCGSGFRGLIEPNFFRRSFVQKTMFLCINNVVDWEKILATEWICTILYIAKKCSPCNENNFSIINGKFGEEGCYRTPTLHPTTNYIKYCISSAQKGKPKPAV
jgi:hypothetical protein